MENVLNSWKLAKLACKHLKVYSRPAHFDKMEDDLHGRRPPWKTTSIEEDLHGRQPPGRRPPWKKQTAKRRGGP